MKEWDRFPDKKQSRVDYDRVTRHIQEAQQINREAGVGQREATWIDFGDYPELPNMFVFMTDVHFGSMGVDYRLLHEHLSMIEDTPNTSVILGGDMVDNFSPKVIPQGMMGDAITPQLQTQVFMDRLLNLDRKGKIGAASWGNHEDFIGAAGYDYYQAFMSEFQAPILDKGGIVDWIVNGGEKYRIAISHKHWGSSKLNITNAPKRQMMYTHEGVDISLTGHTHMAAGEMFDNAGKRKIAVVGGTFKLSDGYGEKNFGKPGTPGFTIAAWPNEKRMELFRDPLIAQAWMLNMIARLEEK